MDLTRLIFLIYTTHIITVTCVLRDFNNTYFRPVNINIGINNSGNNSRNSDLRSIISGNNKSRSHLSHISNQHQGLSKLSEALELFNRQPNTESDQSSIHHSSSSVYTNYNYKLFGNRSPYLKRYMLQNTSVTCNDGTKAGYYLRSSHHSKKWIIFLEGGWYCYSTYTCHQRWLQMRNLMTSAHWSEFRTVGGILSPIKEENPHLWNANHIYVPYCSSDSWSGNSPAKRSADLSFLGSRIIEEVIRELIPKGLFDAKLLLLAGSSAGAGGVLVNLDRIAELLRSLGSNVEVRGIADSGWFLDNEPFKESFNDSLKGSFSNLCTNTINCSPIDSVKQGMKLWNGKLPEKCVEQYPTEPWRCYFGYRMYPTLRTPLFVIQWIFDEAQLIVDNIGFHLSKARWNYIQEMGQTLKKSLQDVKAVFAPSCISHILLTRSEWVRTSINGTTLPQALRCWLQQKCEKHRIYASHDRVLNNTFNGYNKSLTKQVGLNISLKNMFPVGSVEKVKRKSKRRQKKLKKRQQGGIHKNDKTSRDDHHSRNFLRRKNCNHWWVDTCTWPQCNGGCPKIHNPYAGEMNFVEILKSSGFNLIHFAEALGIDFQELNSMEEKELIHLLNQKTS